MRREQLIDRRIEPFDFAHPRIGLFQIGLLHLWRLLEWRLWRLRH
jgi:hypothetical protein